MKFLCDEMLGTLAKWLRILGHDAVYAKNESDDAIARRAGEEHRIVLTRDKELAQRADDALYITHRKVEQQLEEVVKHFSLTIDEDSILSRCTICNIPVVPVAKEEVKSKVPEHIWTHHHTFHRCPRCGRVYWMGSHVEDMVKRIQRLTSH